MRGRWKWKDVGILSLLCAYVLWNATSLPEYLKLKPKKRHSEEEDGIASSTQSETKYSKWRDLYVHKGVEEMQLSLVPHEEDLWIEVMSWTPRAFVLHNALTVEECEYLIDLGQQDEGMMESEVEDKGVSEFRTSTARFLPYELLDSDEILVKITSTAALLTGVHRANQEAIQVLRYEPSQYYMPHHDYIPDIEESQRVLTLLFYLSDVKQGGETILPYANVTEEYSEQHYDELRDHSCP